MVSDKTVCKAFLNYDVPNKQHIEPAGLRWDSNPLKIRSHDLLFSIIKKLFEEMVAYILGNVRATKCYR